MNGLKITLNLFSVAIKYTLTLPGLQKIKRLIFRCICCEWVNLITFGIFLVGKGQNE